MGEIDSAFIQSIEHRPKLTVTDPGEIPVIDLSALDSGAVDLLVADIGKACEEWGFFKVINHGVPLEVVRRIEAAMKEFFDQSIDEKRKVKRDEAKPMGYHDSEHTKNVRDWKEVLDIAVEDPLVISASPDPQDQELTKYYNQWPEYPPEFRKILKEYAGEIEKLAFKLLELISLSLGLARDRLIEFFQGQTSFIRLNHYPPCPWPELALGVGRHKDAGALTVLFQDGVGGLEVKRKADGEWVGVKPIPNAYIINVGDIIQVWSNDKYESVEHRVVANSEKERFSIPFFFFPAHHVNVKPLEELTNEENPPKFKEYNWGKFMATRNRSDFKKQAVENIQIHHFRVSEH